MNTQELTDMLRAKHSGQGWGFVEQVPDATGTRHSRTCDALAMCLWPSKGIHLHGFEIKVFRSDWLKEIQDVSKAAAFSRYCHYWWIVAPKGVLKIEELPADWGWMCPTKANLRVKKPATLTDPQAPDFNLLCGLFRACLKASPSKRQLDARWQSGYDAGREAAKSRRGFHQDSLTRELDNLRESISEFEKRSGIEIRRYDGPRLGDAVALVNKLGLHGLQRRLSAVAGNLQTITEGCSAGAKLLEDALG